MKKSATASAHIGAWCLGVSLAALSASCGDVAIVAPPVNVSTADAGAAAEGTEGAAPGEAVTLTVLSRSPENGAVNVSTKIQPSVTFSADIDDTTMSAQMVETANQTPVPGATTLAVVGQSTLVFTPHAELKKDTHYTFTVNGGIKPKPKNPRDMAVALGTDVVVGFTTVPDLAQEGTEGAPPPQLGLQSVELPVAADAQDAVVTISFNATIDAGSVAAGTVKLVRDPDGDKEETAIVVSANGAQLAVHLAPAATLTAGADYRLTVSKAIKGAGGEVLSSDIVINFRMPGGSP